MEQLEKPPIGLRPRFIVSELRLKEIEAAIERYAAVNKDIPIEWVDEKIEILDWLDYFEFKQAQKIQRQLLDNMTDIPTEFQEIINNNFDKLLYNP